MCLIICYKEVPPVVLAKSRFRTPDHLLVSFKTNKCTKQMIDLMHDAFERVANYTNNNRFEFFNISEKIITWEKLI